MRAFIKEKFTGPNLAVFNQILFPGRREGGLRSVEIRPLVHCFVINLSPFFWNAIDRLIPTAEKRGPYFPWE